MSPIGILATIVLVLAMAVFRWRVLSASGVFDVRAEVPYWLAGGAAIAIAVVLTFAGRLALLVATPFVLIPAGAYLIRRSTRVETEFGINLRQSGWATVVTGLLAGLAAGLWLAIGPD
jgi:hypothetical protein